MLRLAGWTIFGVALAGIPMQARETPLSSAQNVAKPSAHQARDIGSIMHKKLGHAQKVLEGIAQNDFNMIQTNADELVVLSKRAEWMAIRTPDYELNTDSFRRSAQDLIKSAKDRNVDGAALAYVELTMTCVRCHKYVRDTRRTQLAPSLPRFMASQDR